VPRAGRRSHPRRRRAALRELANRLQHPGVTDRRTGRAPCPPATQLVEAARARVCAHGFDVRERQPPANTASRRKRRCSSSSAAVTPLDRRAQPLPPRRVARGPRRAGRACSSRSSNASGQGQALLRRARAAAARRGAGGSRRRPLRSRPLERRGARDEERHGRAELERRGRSPLRGDPRRRPARGHDCSSDRHRPGEPPVAARRRLLEVVESSSVLFSSASIPRPAWASASTSRASAVQGRPPVGHVRHRHERDAVDELRASSRSSASTRLADAAGPVM
jgi:hypothetical protein